jgi:hypothetical protein
MDDPRFTILWDAQFIANDLLRDHDLSYLGAPFTIPHDFDGFVLEYDPASIMGAITTMKNRNMETRSHDEIIDLFPVIVRDAVIAAIHKNPLAMGHIAMEQVIDAATSRTDRTV